MGEQIIFYSSDTEQKFTEIFREFTRIKDQLEIIKQEEECLSAVWQGEAKEDWESEFENILNELEGRITKCRKSLICLKEQAKQLCEEEKQIILQVEAL